MDELVKRLRDAAISADSGYEISESLYRDILQAADELQKRVPKRPHGRLIDADELAAKCDAPFWCVWKSDIDDAPTIIEAEEGE